MVELIVTFALVAAFLTMTTMCVSHAILFYYSETKTMHAYTVADLVLSEVKDEIRSMQGSGEGLNGYVKLRKEDEHGMLVPAAAAGGVYEGTTIEYVASNINDAATAVQIDAGGCGDVLIGEDGKKEILIDGSLVSNADLAPNYLTMRYYSRYPESRIMGYKNLFMDTIVTGTSADASGKFTGLTAQKVVWHAQEKLPRQSYQDYTVALLFQVKPVTDPVGNQMVYSVDVTVRVREGEEIVCEKRRRVDLQNTVYYKSGNTLYSDGPEADS